jgi:DNA-binding transcriptional MocR family regulator
MTLLQDRPARQSSEPTTGYTSSPNAIADLGLTPREEQLVNRLLRHRWTPESTVFVRISVLAASMSCHRRTVERAIDSLVQRGLLAVEARYRDDGGRAANRYILAPELTTVYLSDGRAHDVAESVPSRQETSATLPHTPTASAPRQEQYPGKQSKRTRQQNTFRPPANPQDYAMGRYGPLPPR